MLLVEQRNLNAISISLLNLRVRLFWMMLKLNNFTWMLMRLKYSDTMYLKAMRFLIYQSLHEPLILLTSLRCFLKKEMICQELIDWSILGQLGTMVTLRSSQKDVIAFALIATIQLLWLLLIQDTIQSMQRGQVQLRR